MGGVAVPPTLAASHELLFRPLANTLVGFVFAGEPTFGGALALIDWQLCGVLADTLRSRRFDAARGQRLLIPTEGRLPAQQLVVVGLGRQAEPPEPQAAPLLATVRRALTALGGPFAIALPTPAAFAPATQHALWAAWEPHIKRSLAAADGPSSVTTAFLAPPLPIRATRRTGQKAVSLAKARHTRLGEPFVSASPGQSQRPGAAHGHPELS